ncbi:uncharacterized protein LOC108142385 [Drosophila elegans]|uniref:uncharacterized protein LOC108142385 n=1 Tax=Drosophila elegans TaxID=30023 RepID=UPI0007E8AE05|nr:uncharacterized protein LOC108142385 [Drosophila elegans]
MEQANKISIQVLESDAKKMDTEQAEVEINRLKLEVTRLRAILEKQRKVLQEDEDRRREAKLFFSTLMALKMDNGSHLDIESSDPLVELQETRPDDKQIGP